MSAKVLLSVGPSRAPTEPSVGGSRSLRSVNQGGDSSRLVDCIIDTRGPLDERIGRISIRRTNLTTPCAVAASWPDNVGA